MVVLIEKTLKQSSNEFSSSDDSICPLCGGTDVEDQGVYWEDRSQGFTCNTCDGGWYLDIDTLLLNSLSNQTDEGEEIEYQFLPATEEEIEEDRDSTSEELKDTLIICLKSDIMFLKNKLDELLAGANKALDKKDISLLRKAVDEVGFIPVYTDYSEDLKPKD